MASLFNAEVLSPRVGPQIEQGNNAIRFRFDRSNVRTLETIALKTSEGEVVDLALPAVLSRNHVAGRWAGTSAFMSEINRSSSLISSNSAFSAGVSVPSRWRSINSLARAAACSDGRNAMISSAEGPAGQNGNHLPSQRRACRPCSAQSARDEISQAFAFPLQSSCKLFWNFDCQLHGPKAKRKRRAGTPHLGHIG